MGRRNVSWLHHLEILASTVNFWNPPRIVFPNVDVPANTEFWRSHRVPFYVFCSASESQMRRNLKSKTDCLETCLQDHSLSAPDTFFYIRQTRLLYQQPFSILMRTRSHISRALIHAVMFWRLLQSLSNLHPKHS